MVERKDPPNAADQSHALHSRQARLVVIEQERSIITIMGGMSLRWHPFLHRSLQFGYNYYSKKAFTFLLLFDII